MKYIFLICYILSCSGMQNKIDISECDLISKILEAPNLANHLELNESNYNIRIFDLNDVLDVKTCSYGKYSIKVYDKLIIDLNSGRFIDISVLSIIKQDSENYSLDIVYCKRTPECKRDFVMKGTITIEVQKGNLEIIHSKFESVS